MVRGMLLGALVVTALGCEVANDAPACANGARCGDGRQVCVEGECVACMNNAECGADVCNLGQCVPGCAGNDVCAADQVCVDRRCQEGVTAALAVAGNHQNFLHFSRETGLYDELATSDAVTLFVPTDAAIEALPGDCLIALQLDLDALRAFVRMHIGLGLGRLDPASLRLSAEAGDELPVATVETLTAGLDGEGRVTIEGLPLRVAALEGANGYAYPVLDGVFLPAAGLPEVCEAARR